MATPSLHQAARLYAQAGLSVLPWRYTGAAGSKPQKTPARRWKVGEHPPMTLDEVDAWWDRNPNDNVGSITGPTGAQGGRAVVGPADVVVVDLDGLPAIAWAEKHLPYTPWRVTTGRGLHLGYKYPQTLPPGLYIQNRVALDVGVPGVDLRARGGYVAMPPSLHHSGATYQWPELQPPFSLMNVFDPEWFPEDLYREERPAAPEPNAPDQPPAPADAHQEAIRWLQQEAPVSIEGSGGDNTLFVVASRLRAYYGLNHSQALAALQDHWNDRCQPPWDDERLARAAERGWSLRREEGAPGYQMAAQVRSFIAAAKALRPPTAGTVPAAQSMTAEEFVAKCVDDRALVGRPEMVKRFCELRRTDTEAAFRIEAELNETLGRGWADKLRKEANKLDNEEAKQNKAAAAGKKGSAKEEAKDRLHQEALALNNEYVYISSEDKVAHLTKQAANTHMWLLSIAAFCRLGPAHCYWASAEFGEYRRTVYNMVFIPNGQEADVVAGIDNSLNIFSRDRMLEPAEGEGHLPEPIWQLCMHLAGQNESDANYLLNWLAWRLRYPLTPQCALILAGPRGSGKGRFTTLAMRCTEPYTASVSQAQLEKDWNDHLLNTILVVVPETNVETQKDRRVFEEILREQVLAGERTTINPKGAGKRHVIKAAGWIICTNHDAALGITKDDRRYSVVRGPYSGNAKKDQLPFPVAVAVSRIIEKDVAAMRAFVAHLNHRNLEGFCWNRPRANKARADMVAAAEDPVSQWWSSVLAGEAAGVPLEAAPRFYASAYLMTKLNPWLVSVGEREVSVRRMMLAKPMQVEDGTWRRDQIVRNGGQPHGDSPRQRGVWLSTGLVVEEPLDEPRDA